MSIAEVLYTIIIYPLELLFEVIYFLSNSVIGNPGLSIVFLSIAVNFLILPLYIRADALQKAEREIQEKMNPCITHIKKTFSGDERFLMLQTFYRENDYKPIYILRSILPLLLQVPFFIAAYNFLSGLVMIQGFPFGPISDLGAQDGMILIHGISINVMPILMTLINIISGTIYTKGAPVKDKIQVYGIAVIFLILLYRSPAGLVLYWTLNNIFSLVKNLFYKLKNPKQTLIRLVSYLGMVLVGYTFAKNEYSTRQKMFLYSFAIIMQLPLIGKAIINKKGRQTNNENHSVIFYISTLMMAILTGALIPSAVIASSVSEFVNIVQLNNPVEYVISSMCIAIGYFLVWLLVFYNLSEEKTKRIFEYVCFICSVVCIIDYMFFGTKLGNLSSALKFDISPSYTRFQILINMAAVIGCILVCLILIKRIPKVITPILISGVIVSMGMSVFNVIMIMKDYRETVRVVGNASDFPVITLSRDDPNVIVIMMDRMIGRFIPYMMEEDPSLYEKFDGFTCYTNSVSFGPHTNSGSPGLYGGYEYIPEKMNERDKELLVDKHNEALKVMPVIFDQNKMNVTVFDPKYAGYGLVPDLSIYDNYPNIKRYISMGTIQQKGYDFDLIRNKLKRNFFFYSLFKTAPLVIQPTVYNGGNYNSTDIARDLDDGAIEINGQSTYWLSQSKGVEENFMEAYAVLDNLESLVRLTDEGAGSFFIMSNDTTHNPMILKEPEYEPALEVDNREYDADHFKKYDAKGNMINLDDKNYIHEVNLDKVKHYQANMCAMKKLGAFFDYLRELGIYDNTKIIVVSDHSTDTHIDENYVIEGLDKDSKPTEYDCDKFLCTLMVKDFNAKGFSYNEDFMTNADVPTLAFKDIINDPVNPFTGKKIDSSHKNENEIKVIDTTQWRTVINNGYKYLPEAWLSVHDNVHDKKNWKYIEYK